MHLLFDFKNGSATERTNQPDRAVGAVPPRLPKRRTIAVKPLSHNEINDLRLKAIDLGVDGWRKFDGVA